MKSSILLAASVAVLSMTACGSEPAPGQPAQQQEAAPQKEETGTRIRVGNDGVAIEGSGTIDPADQCLDPDALSGWFAACEKPMHES